MQAKHAKPNKLALRVLSTAAVMAMVTSIAAPADVADTAQDETAAVTPAGAQSTVQADTASTLPQTGVNWLAALASALSGVAMLTAGLFLNRKESKH